MSIYSYSQSPVVDEVTFRKTENGGVRAYLHARENANGRLGEVIKGLQEKGWSCIPATLGDKPVLEVRGFKREEKLIAELAQRNWTGGAVRQCQDEADHLSFKDKLKKRSLQASGLFYLLGDIAYTTYGYKKGHWEDVLAGLFYFGGSSALLGYGRNDQAELQIKDIAKKMKEEVQRQGAALPDHCSMSAITADYNKGLLKSADELLRRYPAETMNTLFGLAGASIAASTFRHHIFKLPHPEWDAKTIRDKKIASWLDVGLGSMTMASGAVSALVKEKARDPDAPLPESVSGKIKDFVQHRPLAIAGMGYIVSTLCHAASTYKDIKTARRINDDVMMKSVPFRAVFVGANLVAEVLMAMSSKGHGEGVVSDTSVDGSVIALAADLIVKQPKHMEETLVPYMAKFLGRPDVLAMKDEEVIRQLRTHIEIARNNPWSCLAQQPRTSVPQWQAKAMLNQSAPQFPSPG